MALWFDINLKYARQFAIFAGILQLVIRFCFINFFFYKNRFLVYFT